MSRTRWVWQAQRAQAAGAGRRSIAAICFFWLSFEPGGLHASVTRRIRSRSDGLAHAVSAKVQMDDQIEAIEAAFVAQWANFGRGPGGTLHEGDGLMWVEAPVPQLPYNAVLRTHLDAGADEEIGRLAARFRERDVQFMWLAHPSARPGDLATRLGDQGLSLVERGTGMTLEAEAWRPESSKERGELVYREVTDEDGMRAYEELIASYWELPPESHAYVFGINRWGHEQGLGVRWVAYRDERPVGKVYLSWLGVEGTAAIFAVYVHPSARGFGAATRLTELAITRALEAGRTRVVLHSSEVAVNLYRRMGFVERCGLPVYATTSLHSLQPS